MVIAILPIISLASLERRAPLFLLHLQQALNSGS
jgi:hypothetical protein